LCYWTASLACRIVTGNVTARHDPCYRKSTFTKEMRDRVGEDIVSDTSQIDKDRYRPLRNQLPKFLADVIRHLQLFQRPIPHRSNCNTVKLNLGTSHWNFAAPPYDAGVDADAGMLSGFGTTSVWL